MDTAPMVSIVIPVYNQVAFTRQCLKTIVRNTPPGLYEIIVVDDASTDETPELLSSWKGKLRTIRSEKNNGFGRACNEGAKAALGQYLVFLNNDTKPLPKWMEYCIEHFQRDPNIGIVGNKLLYPNGTIQHGGITFVPLQKLSGVEFLPLQKLGNVPFPLHRFRGMKWDDPRANRCEEVHSITAACLFIPRELFWSVGGFSEEYGMYFEDTDLNMKIRALGRKIIYEPRSVVIHYESQSTPIHVGNELLIRSVHIFYAKWRHKLENLLAGNI